MVADIFHMTINHVFSRFHKCLRVSKIFSNSAYTLIFSFINVSIRIPDSVQFFYINFALQVVIMHQDLLKIYLNFLFTFVFQMTVNIAWILFNSVNFLFLILAMIQKKTSYSAHFLIAFNFSILFVIILGTSEIDRLLILKVQLKLFFQIGTIISIVLT
jgi:hypothetical protein